MMMAFASFSYGSIATSVPVTCDLTAVGGEAADSIALFDGAVIFSLHSCRVFRAENPYLAASVHEHISKGKPKGAFGRILVIQKLRKEQVRRKGQVAFIYDVV